MTDKELKRLSRAELLEMLLAQTKETERLQNKLMQAEQQLQDKKLRMEKTGDLACAVLEINGVMEAAQRAADQYLENIAAMEAEAKRRCQVMLAQARQEAERISAQSVAPDAVDTLLQDIHQLLDK